MRFLILTGAILAYASGAPSGAILSPLGPAALLAPATVYLPTVPAPAPVTVSPGDLQAAIIDANVQAQDLIRAAVERQRELAEQAVELQKERANEANEQAKLRAEQALWENEEQKWGALEASQVARAKLEGEAAKIQAEAMRIQAEAARIQAEAAKAGAETVKNAETVVKSAFIAPIVPGVAIAYATPGIVAPEVNTGEEAKGTAASSSETSSNQSSQEADANTGKAEEQKPTEEQKPAEEQKPGEEPAKSPEVTSSVQTSSADAVGATPIFKTTIVGDQSIVTQSLTQAHPPYLALSYFSPNLKLSEPLISSPVAFLHPGTKFFSSSVIHTPGHLPTVVKTAW